MKTLFLYFVSFAIVFIFAFGNCFSQKIEDKKPLEILQNSNLEINKTCKSLCKETEDEKIYRAEQLYNNEKYNEAISELICVLTSNSINADAYYLLGLIKYKQGETESAISTLKTAIFWNEKLIEAYILLAEIYQNKSNCLQAKNVLRNAWKIDSDNTKILGLQQKIEQCKGKH